jgi:hypothetical protein
VTFSTRTQKLAPALAVALLLSASPALAEVRPDDRPGPHGVEAASIATAARPDDRAGLRTVAVTPAAALRPDDRAGAHGLGGDPRATQLAVRHGVDAPGRGFDWGAAGVGAGTVSAALVLIATAATLRRRSGRAGIAA